MGCLFVLLSAFAPRLLVVFAWIARPTYFDAVFDTWLFPLLGLIFLPFTTLIWLLVGAPPQVAGIISHRPRRVPRPALRQHHEPARSRPAGGLGRPTRHLPPSSQGLGPGARQ
jgi:hypothetical protein